MNADAKVHGIGEIGTVAERVRSQGRRIVLTNGCFDLLHAGHVMLLQRAREQGDVLIVALNSDRSVRELKGPTRPIVEEDARARVLAALASVDYVTIFDTLRVTTVITAVKPDVFVKGGDYTVETLDAGEREALVAVGAQIVIMPLEEGFSTSGLIRKATEGLD